MTLTCDGPSQRHLVRRIAAEHELVGSVIVEGTPPNASQKLTALIKRYSSPTRLLQHLHARKVNRREEERLEALHHELFQDDTPSADLPAQTPMLRTNNVNSAECIAFARSHSVDAVVVNGTNLLRKPWFEIEEQFRLGILNIHTGLSPYSRGGNCNLFCILHGQLQAVGVTVHYIDAGIDSGNIIFTDRPEISDSDTYQSLEKKVFRLGEDLMMLALKRAAQDSITAVPQWTKGRLFLRKTGYVFEPWQCVLANQRMREKNLLTEYKAMQAHYDESIRWIPPDAPREEWRHPSV